MGVDAEAGIDLAAHSRGRLPPNANSIALPRCRHNPVGTPILQQPEDEFWDTARTPMRDISISAGDLGAARLHCVKH